MGRSGNSVHGLLITHHDAGWRDLTNTKKMTRWSSKFTPQSISALSIRIYNLIGPRWRGEKEAYKGKRKKKTEHSSRCAFLASIYSSPIILWTNQTARTRPSSSPRTLGVPRVIIFSLGEILCALYFTFSSTAALLWLLCLSRQIPDGCQPTSRLAANKAKNG
jgi:hypothetical protein